MLLNEQIEKSIVDYLYWDPRIDAFDVDIEVWNGHVKIKGLVANDVARQGVEQDVATIPGVVSLDSHLAVKASSNPPILADEEIRENVERFVWANPNVDPSSIDVSVKEGFVTLAGTVDVYWKKLFVEQIADIRDVRGIINRLSVVPSENILDKEVAQDIIVAINKIAGGGTASVNVKVDRGRVTLSGPVPNWRVHRAVRKAAVSTPGVIDLDSDKLEIAELAAREYRMSLR